MTRRLLAAPRIAAVSARRRRRAPRAGHVGPHRLRAAAEAENWLTYSGDVFSRRHSPLVQITPANVKNLELQWVFQAQSLEKFEATPLAVDGVLVYRAAAQRYRRPRRHDGPDFLDLQLQTVAAGASVLRTCEPRPGDPWRPAVHGHHRRPSASRSTRRAAGRSGTWRSKARGPRPAMPSPSRRRSSKTS